MSVSIGNLIGMNDRKVDSRRNSDKNLVFFSKLRYRLAGCNLPPGDSAKRNANWRSGWIGCGLEFVVGFGGYNVGNFGSYIYMIHI